MNYFERMKKLIISKNKKINSGKRIMTELRKTQTLIN